MDFQSADRTGKPDIAVVVGSAAQQARVAGCLTSFYRLREYRDSAQAIAGCRAQLPRLALVSEEMTGGNGFDFVRMLRLDPKLAAVPVVMMVARDDNVARDRLAQCGADSLVLSRCPPATLVTAISDLLNRRVEHEWRSLHALQRQALTGTLELFNGIANGICGGTPILFGSVSEACGPLVEAVANNDFREILLGVRNHDNYSYAHSVRVATYLALFGFNLRLPKEEQVILASGGLLHDVGKMLIPREVLNKPGRLTAAEFEVMKGHVAASRAYLTTCIDLPKGIMTIAAQHHERLDGMGYPDRLPGSKLNRLARMASIIDVFSALTDRRVYKPAMGAEAALKIMSDEMASHLDLKLLGLFRQMLLDATENVSTESD